MTTSAVSSTSNTAIGDQFKSIKPKEAAMGKDEFLKLLTTQLQYQDPLDPMDNTQFITQLAQFSTLESMKAMESKVGDNNLLLQSLNSSYATSMIGKEMKANGSSIYLNGTGGANLDYTLSKDAAKVEIGIYDEIGNKVRSVTYGNQPSGANAYMWDGKDSNGNTLLAGKYTYSITATAGDGSPIGSNMYSTGIIDGVAYEQGVPFLTIGKDRIPFSNIVKVSEAKK